MGIIIGKFRKKKSTMEVLEKLESEITSIEEFGRDTELRRRRIIRRFVLLAVLTYLLLALVLYFYSHKLSTNQNYIYLIPLIAFPIIVYLIKNFLTWYYSRKLRKNEQKLVRLKEDKKKMLNNVMETETYKVAKEILDKFGNDRPKPTFSMKESTPRRAVEQRSSSMSIRQRNVNVTPFNPERPTSSRLPIRSQMMVETPIGKAVSSSALIPSRLSTGLTATPNLKPNISTPGTLELPRPLLPNNRTVLDKMVDYLVGDGPSNRFALICKNCYCHNGMAFKEEFEYLSFRCVYCSHFNPAPKKRLSRPNFESPPKIAMDHSSDSDASTVDSDQGAKGPVITELRPDSPDTEKNSDFDKLSDLDVKEEVSVSKEEPMDVVDESTRGTVEVEDVPSVEPEQVPEDVGMEAENSPGRGTEEHEEIKQD